MFLLLQSTHRMMVQYHSQIGHLYVPNLKARMPDEGDGYYVATNSLGFRSDVEFKKEKGERPRILFFGDSYTAGDNCKNADRFTDRVGEMLDADVYNYGLSGSGTDQHLLIYEQFARDVQADLIVLCVQLDSMKRIQVSHRESIDRVTRQRVLVPKPYFLLENGELMLHNVPVPLERPAAGQVEVNTPNGDGDAKDGLVNSLADFYRSHRHLEKVRKVVRSRVSRVHSEVYRRSGMQPYDDYRSADSPGWQLMEAIIRRFIDRVAPVPVLIVPVPTYHFTAYQADPIYQKLFEQLEDPERGVSVLDVTTPLAQLPWKSRLQLEFRFGDHFTPYGHQLVADRIADKIKSLKVLPQRKSVEQPAVASSAASAAVLTSKAKSQSRYILGISAFYHDSAACLIKDGEIVAAAEEERFSRIKNDRRFPHYAANYCLEEGGVNPSDLAAVVYYDNPALTFERLLCTQLAVAEEGDGNWVRFLPSWVQYKLHLPQLIRSYLHYDGLLLQNSHHRSHCASAFYPSPFERAAVLTIDGVGEWATAAIGVGQGNRIEMLKEMRFPHSLGLLYSAFTQFTGFKVNSGEYKMMGLAPYGEPKYVDVILKHLVDLKEDGSIELNMDYFGFLSKFSMTNERFAELFDGPARAQESRITRREMDIARSIQVVTEESMLRMARHAHKITGEKYLCLSGGVALNCVANGRLLREGPFEDIWIQPAAGDAGSAIGAALDVYHTYFQEPRTVAPNGRSLQKGSYWGPGFSADEIRAFLNTHGYPYQELTDEERADKLAHYMQEGKVIGHFSGRAELGPRALGARSIIGDARNEEMQVTLNLKVKYRESFRPFAPTVLAERVSDYFELDRPSPYMLLVAGVKKERRLPFELGKGEDMLEVVRRPRSDVPAITHVDYSARVQTIRRDDHPAYYDLIRRFEELTGCGVIVNTSFNVRGEPIVCTPYDAYRCFMRTEMDILVLDNFLLLKEEQPLWPESKGHIEEADDFSSAPSELTPLEQKLRKIYTKEFLPLARRLKSKEIHGIDPVFRPGESKWDDCENLSDPFTIPAELDNSAVDPEAIAGAMVRYWATGERTKELKSLLVKLLQLGLRYPLEETLDEEVSDSVYVMF